MRYQRYLESENTIDIVDSRKVQSEIKNKNKAIF